MKKMFKYILLALFVTIGGFIFFVIGMRIDFYATRIGETTSVEHINDLERCRIEMITNGDSASYEEYLAILPQWTKYQNIDGVSWSLLMANKHCNRHACRHIYDCLITWNSLNIANIDSIDETSREIALHYLDKASRLGDKSSEMLIDSLRRSRPEYFIPENNKIFTTTMKPQ
jgi:hypothetical protein